MLKKRTLKKGGAAAAASGSIKSKGDSAQNDTNSFAEMEQFMTIIKLYELSHKNNDIITRTELEKLLVNTVINDLKENFSNLLDFLITLRGFKLIKDKRYIYLDREMLEPFISELNLILKNSKILENEKINSQLLKHIITYLTNLLFNFYYHTGVELQNILQIQNIKDKKNKNYIEYWLEYNTFFYNINNKNIIKKIELINNLNFFEYKDIFNLQFVNDKNKNGKPIKLTLKPPRNLFTLYDNIVKMINYNKIKTVNTNAPKRLRTNVSIPIDSIPIDSIPINEKKIELLYKLKKNFLINFELNEDDFIKKILERIKKDAIYEFVDKDLIETLNLLNITDKNKELLSSALTEKLELNEKQKKKNKKQKEKSTIISKVTDRSKRLKALYAKKSISVTDSCDFTKLYNYTDIEKEINDIQLTYKDRITENQKNKLITYDIMTKYYDSQYEIITNENIINFIYDSIIIYCTLRVDAEKLAFENLFIHKLNNIAFSNDKIKQNVINKIKILAKGSNINLNTAYESKHVDIDYDFELNSCKQFVHAYVQFHCLENSVSTEGNSLILVDGENFIFNEIYVSILNEIRSNINISNILLKDRNINILKNYLKNFANYNFILIKKQSGSVDTFIPVTDENVTIIEVNQETGETDDFLLMLIKNYIKKVNYKKDISILSKDNYEWYCTYKKSFLVSNESTKKKKETGAAAATGSAAAAAATGAAAAATGSAAATKEIEKNNKKSEDLSNNENTIDLIQHELKYVQLGVGSIFSSRPDVPIDSNAIYAMIKNYITSDEHLNSLLNAELVRTENKIRDINTNIYKGNPEWRWGRTQIVINKDINRININLICDQLYNLGKKIYFLLKKFQIDIRHFRHITNFFGTIDISEKNIVDLNAFKSFIITLNPRVSELGRIRYRLNDIIRREIFE
jgi:hypothetical protein